jgi:hypothetical protein
MARPGSERWREYRLKYRLIRGKKLTYKSYTCYDWNSSLGDTDTFYRYLCLFRLLDCTVGHIRIIFVFLVLNKMAVLADFENSEKVRDVSF